jgi:hypothetical protein
MNDERTKNHQTFERHASWRQWLATAAVVLATTVAGCFDSGGLDSDAGAEGDTTKMSDGGDTTVPDTGPDGCETQPWYVDSDGDGYGKPNETKKACEKPDGYVDNADDCDDSDADINPDATEVCDGVDQNCNGTDDSNESSSELADEDCDKQDGVCSGATISVCTDDGSSYETCGADQYGEDYRSSDDEAWRCDSKDNDCDGDSDEACCDQGTAPSAVQIGDMSNDQSYPVIAPASQNAPNDAKFVVAWAVGQELKLEHVDETGSDVNFGTESLSSAIASIDIVPFSDRYAALLTTDAGEVLALEFDANLSFQGNKTTVHSNSGGTVGEISGSVKGQTIWISYGLEAPSGDLIYGAGLDASNWSLSTTSFAVSNTSNPLPKPGAPEVAVVGGTPTIVWWHAGMEEVRGARISGGTTTNEFSYSVSVLNTQRAEPISARSVSDELIVVFPDFSVGNGALHSLSLQPGATGMQSGATQITGSSATNRAPSAVPVDPNGDGTAEELAVTWEQGNTTDPSIMVGSTSLSSPGKMSGREVVSNFPKAPDITSTDGKAGTSWLNKANQNSKDVKYAPISIDGVPVCTPNP